MPDDYALTKLETVIVPASEMIHTYYADFPRQIRGISWLMAGLREINRIQSLVDKGVLATEVAVSFPGMLIVPDDFAPRVKDGQSEEQAVEEALAMFQNAIDAFPTDKRIVYGSGITWQQFGSQTPLDGPGFRGIMDSVVDRLASGLGLTKYTLTGNAEGASYSALQHITIKEKDTFEGLQEVVENFTCRVVKDWLRYKDIQYLGFPQEMPKFIRPRLPSIDPFKDSQASKVLVESEIMSRQEEQRSRGLDPEVMKQEQIEWNNSVGASKSKGDSKNARR